MISGLPETSPDRIESGLSRKTGLSRKNIYCKEHSSQNIPVITETFSRRAEAYCIFCHESVLVRDGPRLLSSPEELHSTNCTSGQALSTIAAR